MNFKKHGYKLKKEAKPKGNLVSVDISNMYNLSKILSHFFYKKHHEWLAICFIKKDFRCKKIWFNKGKDNTSVSIGLSPSEINKIATENNTRYIFISHNHPGSSKKSKQSDIDILLKFLPKPKGISKYFKDNNSLKYRKLNFSDQDLSTRNKYESLLDHYMLKYGEGLFVNDKLKIWGNSEIVKNYKETKKSYERKNDEVPNIFIAFLFIIFILLYFMLS